MLVIKSERLTATALCPLSLSLWTERRPFSRATTDPPWLVAAQATVQVGWVDSVLQAHQLRELNAGDRA